jgi:hypothetical protein
MSFFSLESEGKTNLLSLLCLSLSLHISKFFSGKKETKRRKERRRKKSGVKERRRE